MGLVLLHPPLSGRDLNQEESSYLLEAPPTASPPRTPKIPATVTGFSSGPTPRLSPAPVLDQPLDT
jgi:hypothetical protein